MRKTLLVLLVLLHALFACSRSPAAGAASAQEVEAVRACFEAYRQALLAADGKAALALVDRNTIDYFDQMVDLALYGEEATVRGQSSVNKIMVLSLRHRMSRERLLKATAESVFVHAVNEGWIGKNGVIAVELGTIRVRHDSATAAIMAQGKEAPVSFTFHKEPDGWRIDLAALMSLTDLAFKQLLAQLGKSEDEAIADLLEAVSGREVSPQVWQPAVPPVSP